MPSIRGRGWLMPKYSLSLWNACSEYACTQEQYTPHCAGGQGYREFCTVLHSCARPTWSLAITCQLQNGTSSALKWPLCGFKNIDAWGRLSTFRISLSIPMPTASRISDPSTLTTTKEGGDSSDLHFGDVRVYSLYPTLFIYFLWDVC